eukprot:2456326-Rhodomonas_salina.3
MRSYVAALQAELGQTCSNRSTHPSLCFAFQGSPGSVQPAHASRMLWRKRYAAKSFLAIR